MHYQNVHLQQRITIYNLYSILLLAMLKFIKDHLNDEQITQPKQNKTTQHKKKH